jgi:hypothetical protein
MGLRARSGILEGVRIAGRVFQYGLYSLWFRIILMSLCPRYCPYLIEKSTP